MPSEDLLVYLRGEQIGRLQVVRNGARFRYEPSYVENHPGGVLLSTALPIGDEPFDRETTRRWFMGLLPEDERLSELFRFFDIPSGSYVDLLREVGWECAGAVRVVPEPGDEAAADEEALYVTLDETDLARRLSALPSHPFDSASTMRVSLGGHQEKLCIAVLDDIEVVDGCVNRLSAALPLGGAPTTHILKPQPKGRFPGLCEGEAWAMAAAGHATNAARVALYRAQDGTPVVLVRRYDRVVENGRAARIHQEDCAQALGLDPREKYASERVSRKSDPSFQKVAAVLAAYALEPHAQMLTLLRQMVVNLVLGNTDAHAKNYSILHDDAGNVSLSPLYDVVPAREITPEVMMLGMRVGGHIRADRIDRESVIGEARSWGVSSRSANRELDATLDDLECGIEAASRLYPEAGSRHAAPAQARAASLRASR